MKMQQILDIARRRGLQPGRLGKTELVRAIQRAEGNFDCYATAYDGVCDQYQCLWREDCFAAARPPVRARQPAAPTRKRAKSAVPPLARKKKPASR